MGVRTRAVHLLFVSGQWNIRVRPTEKHRSLPSLQTESELFVTHAFALSILSYRHPQPACRNVLDSPSGHRCALYSISGLISGQSPGGYVIAVQLLKTKRLNEVSIYSSRKSSLVSFRGTVLQVDVHVCLKRSMSALWWSF